MSNGGIAGRQPDEPELLGEVLSLADELAQRIPDTEVEARLRQALANHAGTASETLARTSGKASQERDSVVYQPGEEITLGPAAIRVLLGFSDQSSRKGLASALRTELVDGPNADKEIRFDSNITSQVYANPRTPVGMVYTATPLSFEGYTAIHRRMNREELRRLRREQGRSVGSHGFYVVDILPAESAFTRAGPRLA